MLIIYPKKYKHVLMYYLTFEPALHPVLPPLLLLSPHQHANVHPAVAALPHFVPKETCSFDLFCFRSVNANASVLGDYTLTY